MKNPIFISLPILALAFAGAVQAQDPSAAPLAGTMAKLESELVARHGEEIRQRLVRGMNQVRSLWRTEDGDAAAFESLVRTHFAAGDATRDQMFERMEIAFEQIGGHLTDLVRELRMHVDLDRGPILPFDQILAGYSPGAHLTEDLFQNKIAFVVLLNFRLTTLQERLAEGHQWSRREWAEARLAQQFGRRVPADVNLAIGEASSRAGAYIAQYNLWMHHALDEQGRRLFPRGLRLISHWNLRDDLKAAYSEKEGLPKQRLIQQVMERIVTQSIPAVVIDSPRVDWKPFSNTVVASSVADFEEGAVPALSEPPSGAPEPDTRYARLLDIYRAVRRADPYSPMAPTLIARRFDENREIPEARVRAMFEQVLASPLAPRVARLIEKRLGRPLEPFDIWYNGFKPRGAYTEAELDAIVSKKYPTAAAFHADIPNILRKLGFSEELSDYLAANIEVHPSRGAGHAFGAGRRGDKAYLRTRVEKGGMNYKGYNIAVHELGHNVEQILSTNRIDHTLLQGVPNTAFTEALAFVFQARDLELLGLASPDEASKALGALDDFWGTYEIAGVALVDMAVWHWMYDNPDATPAQLREATVRISKDVWNRYYASIFRRKDVVLLGVYSHMISSTLYLPDYPIGRMIAFQIKQQMERKGEIGPEFARMAVIGNVIPDLWMTQATGAPVGPEALLKATAEALGRVK
ncbi:MAG TPA: hypothetical protein VMT00_09835 [Thermoanaerobaculia bacterium]|nr:hypothetical protein [Thermoanaerobaculia bacterium]